MNRFFRFNILLPLFSLTACNLFGFMDSPKGDLQLLEAARSCLDRADFVCAKEYYQALSSSYSNVKISENSLVVFGENNIFYLSDLISSLGSGAGSGSTIVSLAELMNTRGKTNSTTRTTIQSRYAAENTITDETLKAYSQMISSLTMLSSILGSAVGADGVLTQGDLVKGPAACRAAGNNCITSVDCDKPAVTALDDDLQASDVSSLLNTTNWDTANSVKKLTEAARSANDAIKVLTGSASTGLFSALDALGSLPGKTDRCRRQVIMTTLFPE